MALDREFMVVCVVMDQDYERRLLRQINHQNLPEGQLAKVSGEISPAAETLTLYES